MTRSYNFRIRFTQAQSPSVLCRIRFNRRFRAAEMLDDFPKNVTAGFLDQLALMHGAPTSDYRLADDNALEIVSANGVQSFTDAERAILLNLIDFGQDFESKVSKTIAEVEFPVSDAASFSIETLLTALTDENKAAMARMSALMREFPSDSEDAARDWPSEDHERYFFQLRIELPVPMPAADLARYKSMLQALHEVNMWTGFSADRGVQEIIRSGRTGSSYELNVEPGSISYLVERPACNPALPAVWLWQTVEDTFGKPAKGTVIFVTAED
jgi:hypothetical protein